MAPAAEDTLIVTLPTAEDFEETRKRILKIRGVRDAEFNNFSHKLRVHYEGGLRRKEEIHAEITRLIAPYEN